MRTRIVKGTMNISSDGDIEFHTFGGDLTFRAGGKNEWTSPQTIVGAYEPISVENFLEKKDENNMNFIIHAFISNNEEYSLNYNIEWNFDPFTKEHRIKNLFSKCTKNKNEFMSFYKSIKLNNQTYYYPAILRIINNQDQGTERNTIIPICVVSNDINKIKKEKILLEYDNTIFDAGFTNDGKRINNTTFELKYAFKNTIQKINDTEMFNLDTANNTIILHNFIIKSKAIFEEEKEIKFLNTKNKVVGVIVVKPNNTVIKSKRKFKYIKIVRTSLEDTDRILNKREIFNTQVYNSNYERIKSENNNENQYLKEFHKAMVETSYCRLGIVFSEECEIEDMLLSLEDENKLAACISEDKSKINNGKSGTYHKLIREFYCKSRGIEEEQLKNYVLVFISPIKPVDTSAAVIYEMVESFSLMTYDFSQNSLLHEMGHKVGLWHTFNDTEILDRIISNSQNEKMKLFLEKMKDYNSIFFENPFKINAEGKMERNNITDNIMDYSSIQYCFYEYQFEVIKKLYNEFKHI